MEHSASRPIVVGIDGSKHAIRGAIWALDEAVSRDTHLRLVHVIDGHSRDRDTDYACTRHMLHGAWDAVEVTGES